MRGSWRHAMSQPSEQHQDFLAARFASNKVLGLLPTKTEHWRREPMRCARLDVTEERHDLVNDSNDGYCIISIPGSGHHKLNQLGPQRSCDASGAAPAEP
ncbi:hypothetical protein FQZ97_224160 [compost metagenome]